MRRTLALACLALVTAGCGGGGASSVLEAGICRDVSQTCVPVGPAKARAELRAARRGWLTALHANAGLDATHRFPTPPPRVLLARLRSQAVAHVFKIESVVWRHGRQPAPDIVLETSQYLDFTHSLPQIVDAIDPPPSSNEHVYEGIFVEGVDPQHVPFVAVFDDVRGRVSGGEWARSEPLYPYAHG
ncbi:MAG TPA: hypothetical protein VFA30_00430 [Gaiellaceae bacterium]|nr:hypothetical protein [Gaiellaceae bacterium]